MAVVNTGMTKGEMKKLLIKSKDEPVNCAIGIGENAAYGLLMLHKTKSGLGLEKELKSEFSEIRNTRWGTAFVDVDDNPKLVKLTLNRAVSGMARKLIKTLKGTGFSKVIILLEDGSTVESHEEEDEEDADRVAAAPATPAETPAADAGPVPPPPPGPMPTGKSPEEKAAEVLALQKILATLAPMIPKAAGDDAARKAMLMKLATDANVNLRTGNLVYAANFLDQLKRALQGPPPVALQDLINSRSAWTGAQNVVRGEVDKLHAELAKTYKDQSFAGEISTRFQNKVAPVLEQFDDQLLDVLDDMMNTKDPAERDKLVVQARGLLKGYLAFAMTDPLIGDLDANPFVKLNIRGSVTSTLAGLAKTMH